MTDKWLSDCHAAPVKVVGTDEGTNHWECTKCGQPCNAHQTAPNDELETILLDLMQYNFADGTIIKDSKPFLDAKAALIKWRDEAVVAGRIDALKFSLGVAQDIDNAIGIAAVIYNEIEMLTKENGEE